MIIVVFKTGQRMEVPEATDVARRAGLLILRDWQGLELGAFSEDDIDSFEIEPSAASSEAPGSEPQRKRRYARRESPRRSR